MINRYKKELKISATENIDCFLMYDADVQSVVENIKKCDAKAVLSRPCIEEWEKLIMIEKMYYYQKILKKLSTLRRKITSNRCNREQFFMIR